MANYLTNIIDMTKIQQLKKKNRSSILKCSVDLVLSEHSFIHQIVLKLVEFLKTVYILSVCTTFFTLLLPGRFASFIFDRVIPVNSVVDSF